MPSERRRDAAMENFVDKVGQTFAGGGAGGRIRNVNWRAIGVICACLCLLLLLPLLLLAPGPIAREEALLSKKLAALARLVSSGNSYPMQHHHDKAAYDLQRQEAQWLLAEMSPRSLPSPQEEARKELAKALAAAATPSQPPPAATATAPPLLPPAPGLRPGCGQYNYHCAGAFCCGADAADAETRRSGSCQGGSAEGKSDLQLSIGGQEGGIAGVCGRCGQKCFAVGCSASFWQCTAAAGGGACCGSSFKDAQSGKHKGCDPRYGDRDCAACGLHCFREVMKVDDKLKMEFLKIRPAPPEKKAAVAVDTAELGWASPPPAPPLLPLKLGPAPSSKVHCMYYGWYGNPKTDKRWYHWDHPQLPHWDKNIARNYPTGRHKGGDDVGSNFYPQLGAYSSRDPKVILAHMQQMRAAGCGVAVVSWYPPSSDDVGGGGADDRKGGANGLLPLLFPAAQATGVRIAFHVEPYSGRSPETLLANARYVHSAYGAEAALFRHKNKPVLYVYDSYRVGAADWARALRPGSGVRGTKDDCIFVALVVEQAHLSDAITAGFDGVYTYFASPISYGAKIENWQAIATTAKGAGLMWIPCVGPGYVDTRVRPWNGGATIAREGGAYYDRGWQAALATQPAWVGITSFNEWHEGTQIEPAVPKAYPEQYADYSPQAPSFYLDRTRHWAKKLDHALASDSIGGLRRLDEDAQSEERK